MSLSHSLFVSALSKITKWLFVTRVSKSSALFGNGLTLYLEPNNAIPNRLRIEVLRLPFSPIVTSIDFEGIIELKNVLKNHSRNNVLYSESVNLLASVSTFIESKTYFLK